MKKRARSQKEIDHYLSFQRSKYALKSIFRKAKRLIVDFVPLESMPSDFLIFENEVRPMQKSMVFPPRSLGSVSIPTESSLNPVQIYAMEKVWVTADSTMFISASFNTVFYEKIEDNSAASTIVYNTKNLLFHSQRLAKINNSPRIENNAEVFFLGGTFCTNYFHFLIEILAKFEFFHSIPNYEKLIIVVNQEIEKMHNLRTLLSFFINPARIQFISADIYYNFSRIWHISYPNVAVPNIGEGEEYRAEFAKFSRKSIEYLQETCLKNFDISKVNIDVIDRVFLARKSEIRKYNEAEVLSIAENYGFKAVYLEDLNIHEQMFLMQNALYIIGASGAAWTNVIFCQSGKSKGLLWLANVWTEFSVFSTLAEFSGFELFHLRFGDDKLGFHQDYQLDLLEFEVDVRRLLNLDN